MIFHQYCAASINVTLSEHPAYQVEKRCASKMLKNAAFVSLYTRLGFSEATLAMLNLIYLLESTSAGALIAMLSLFGRETVLKRLDSA